MAEIDESSRVIGQLESDMKTLFHKQDVLCHEVKTLSKDIKSELKIVSLNLQRRKLWDSAKIVTGAFLGGAAAVIAKMAIWR